MPRNHSETIEPAWTPEDRPLTLGILRGWTDEDLASVLAEYDAELAASDQLEEGWHAEVLALRQLVASVQAERAMGSS